MPTASRLHALARIRALTGAPALLLGWSSALWVGAGVAHGDVSLHDWLPERAVLAAWCVALGLLALSHLGVALVSRRAAAVRGDGPAPDEGRTLRVAAGALALVGTGTLLGLLAPAAYGASNPAEVYARIDALLAVPVGVGAACVIGAAAGLYIAEELPRAVLVLGASAHTRGARATQVISIALGAILFAVTMNVASHFSVGRALLGAVSGATP